MFNDRKSAMVCMHAYEACSVFEEQRAREMPRLVVLTDDSDDDGESSSDDEA